MGSKQKEGECARDWAARLQLLMFYFMRKEVLDSEKYKKTLSMGRYANQFSGRDLTHYDWATPEYWSQLLAYIHDDTAKAPWSNACWERYEYDNTMARENNRQMARSEGGKAVAAAQLANFGPRVEMGFINNNIPML